MSEQIFSKKLALCLGVLAVIFSASYLALAWQDPTAIPPNNNVALPINTSTTSQAKLGSFGVGGIFSAYGGKSTATLVVADSFVGIGISADNHGLDGGTVPSFALEVQDNDASWTTPFILRTMNTGSIRTGATAITPSVDGFYLSYGGYAKDGIWWNDPYIQSGTATTSKSGAKIFISKNNGARWSAWSSVGINQVTNAIGWFDIASNVALWDRTGVWTGKAKPQIASSTSLSTCDSTNVGRIEYRVLTGEGHFWGCISSSTSEWKRLDN